MGCLMGTGKISIRAITPFSRPSPSLISDLITEGMMYVLHQSSTPHSPALPMSSKSEPHVVQGRPLQKDYCPGSPGHPQEDPGIVAHTPESIRSPFLCDPLVIWHLKSPLLNHLLLHPCILGVWWVWLPASTQVSAASPALRMERELQSHWFKAEAHWPLCNEFGCTCDSSPRFSIEIFHLLAVISQYPELVKSTKW